MEVEDFRLRAVLHIILRALFLPWLGANVRGDCGSHNLKMVEQQAGSS
jgi:hypothetical protein